MIHDYRSANEKLNSEKMLLAVKKRTSGKEVRLKSISYFDQ